MRNLFIFLILFTSLKGFSQEIITDRPDQTESSSTVPKHSLQIESGIQLTTRSSLINTEKQLLLPTSLFRVGLTKGIELRVLNQLELYKERKDTLSIIGISDLEIGTKIQLFQKKGAWVEIAFLSHLILPVGTFGLSNKNYGTINKLSISHELNKKSSIGYNIGYDYFGENNGDFTYSLTYGFNITEKTSIYIEPFGRINNFSQNQTNFDFGFCYLLKKNIQYDFSFGIGVTQRMNYISTGLSWLIQR